MSDIRIVQKGNDLQITVTVMGVDGVPSASGKTSVLASTRGNTPVALSDGTTVYVGLNVYRK